MEKDIQTQVLNYLNSIPHCIAENVSGNASQSGRADINACYQGRCIKIELKDPENRGYGATKQQVLYLKKWEKAGAVAVVCYGLEEVKELMKGMMCNGEDL